MSRNVRRHQHRSKHGSRETVGPTSKFPMWIKSLFLRNRINSTCTLFLAMNTFLIVTMRLCGQRNAKGTSPTGYDALRRNSWVELSCKLCSGDITNSVGIHHQLNSRGYATVRRPRRIYWRFTYDETMQRSQKITFSMVRAGRWHMTAPSSIWQTFLFSIDILPGAYSCHNVAKTPASQVY